MANKHISYQTQGTCSQMIDVTADENDVIQQVFFLGGCNGNLKGISQLITGMKIDDVISKLDGTRCGDISFSFFAVSSTSFALSNEDKIMAFLISVFDLYK